MAEKNEIREALTTDWDSEKVVTIYPVDGSDWYTLRVEKSAKVEYVNGEYGMEWEKAVIAWPSFGGVTQEVAEAFSRGIIRATEIAKELDEKLK